MRTISVEEQIHKFLSEFKSVYGTYNNVVKAIISRLADLQEEVEFLRDKYEHHTDFAEDMLEKSLTRPQTVSAYSEGPRSMNVLQSGPPTSAPAGLLVQPLPKKTLQRDLQLVFNALDNKEGVKPSDFLKKQEEIKLTPPPT